MPHSAMSRWIHPVIRSAMLWRSSKTVCISAPLQLVAAPGHAEARWLRPLRTLINVGPVPSAIRPKGYLAKPRCDLRTARLARSDGLWSAASYDDDVQPGLASLCLLSPSTARRLRRDTSPHRARAGPRLRPRLGSYRRPRCAERGRARARPPP